MKQHVMKRIFAVITSCVIGTAGMAFAAGNVGIVNTVSGTVRNYHRNESQPEIVQVGGKVYIEDRIVTDKDGSVQIIFRDDSAVTLGPSSELVIDSDTYNALTGKRETILSLVRGKLRSVVGKQYSRGGSKYEIRTHTAIAGVRGTENIVEAKDQPAQTLVYGIVNTTYAKNSDPKVKGELNLGPNQGARVNQGQPPEPFDFDFEDPAFLELINQTTNSGGSEVEDDILMDTLGNDMSDIPGAEQPFEPDTSPSADKPPLDQTPEQEPQSLYPENERHGYY
ncbi:MAG: FecR family protein [Candidatus Auribacterota bacterium]|nr:FecR family protein [Candidatus Auribacterota bacterium]